LVATTLGGDVDGPTLLRLWNATQGNVLFLRELVFEGLERKLLVSSGGVWRWAGRIAPGTRLVELVESRIGQLAPDERRVLEVVALGEPVGAGVLEGLAPPAATDELQRRDLLQVNRSGRRLETRVAHPLYGDATRARISRRHARELCGALASALAGTGARRREDLLRVATWRLESGAPGPPELLVAGA